VTDDLELLDDPEVMRLDPEVADFDLSGDVWDWVPPWEFQNAYGADRRLWGEGRPPLTTWFRENADPHWVEHLTDRTREYRLRRYVETRMVLIGMHTAEDVIQDVIVEVDRIGVAPGDEWSAMAHRVAQRRIDKLIRIEHGERGTQRSADRERVLYEDVIAKRGTRPFEHADPEDEVTDHDPLANVEAPEFVTTRLPDAWLDFIEDRCSLRERLVLLWRMESGMSHAEIAGTLGISETNSQTLLERAIDRLKE
jgi:RNA polymerase sigma factor (sigma-70 family)